MVTGIDDNGHIRLSRQAVLEGWTVEEAQERDRGGKSRSGGGSRSNGRDSHGSRDRRGGGGSYNRR